MLITSPLLTTLPGVAHGFFTREGGVSGGVYASLNGGLGSDDARAAVLENRRRMADALGVGSGQFLTVHQVHSPRAVVATGPWDGAPPRADAMATRAPGLALAAASADCGPVLLADAAARVVGAAHAGWKGALGGVLEAVVEAMEGLGATRGRITAAVGPMIGPGSYEVGPEVAARFQGEDPSGAAFLRSSANDGRSMLDLPGFIAARLRRIGVGAVEDLGLDTYADEARFFSYRRATHRGEPDYGRHLSAIALVP